ncbi:MAG: TIGR01777 family oxidoreductase [candidate division Zixibacteria bacterium]|nr:TIGR01777 family oxidoreductase [candidate division Zixibacteria bacterium]
MMSRILIAGSSGLVGTALTEQLLLQGDLVTCLIRRPSPTPSGSQSSLWNPYEKKIDLDEIDGHDTIICLSGAAISDSRWTDRRMQVLVDSRVKPTAYLSETIARLRRIPNVFLVASAVGFYGNMAPDMTADEQSHAGEGFLADLCKLWENSTSAAEAAGIRTVHLRFGIILTPDAGALAKMLPMFRKGLGGKIGSGRQMMSWITLDDAVRAIIHVINEPSLTGPVNIVSPNAVSNAEFSHLLGKILGKPAVASLPAVAARLLFGKMADETILSSQNVIPRKLLESGFEFDTPELESALESLLR